MAILGREKKEHESGKSPKTWDTVQSVQTPLCRWDNATLRLRCSCLKYACWRWWAAAEPVTSEDWSTTFPSGQKQIQQDNKNNSRTCKNLTESLLTFPVSYLPLFYFFFHSCKTSTRTNAPMLWLHLWQAVPPPPPPDEDDRNVHAAANVFHWVYFIGLFAFISSSR